MAWMVAARFPTTYSETTSSDDEYSDDSSQYSDQNEYTIEILVNMKFAGAIIGRKGSNIRRMEKQSNATIRLEDGPLSDSLITICGTWESILEALDLLIETVSSYSTDNVLTFKLIVCQSRCGQIIGSGGHKKRKIENSTGASLYISHDHMTNRKKKVLIHGNPESILSCIVKILEIVIERPATESRALINYGISWSPDSEQTQSSQVSPVSHDSRPATESSSSGSQQTQSSQVSPVSHDSVSQQTQSLQVSPVSHDSSSGRSVTAFSGQSTSASATLSNSQSTAGPSSAGTLQASAVSSADCRAFGELVTDEMQKLNSQQQSLLQKEILASIAKFKKAEADSRLNEAIDDCSICLDKVKNKTFIGECLHFFCYNCIQEWTNMKPTCPICLGGIKSLLYNIRSNDDYDVYQFPDSQPRSSEDTAFVGYAFVM